MLAKQLAKMLAVRCSERLTRHLPPATACGPYRFFTISAEKHAIVHCPGEKLKIEVGLATNFQAAFAAVKM